ncbi:MAG: hypothetical protein ACI835_000014 [Planctomycetota bacterium]|jgi:hypothetical protein
MAWEQAKASRSNPWTAAIPPLVCEGKISSNSRYGLIGSEGLPIVSQLDDFEINGATPDADTNAILFCGLNGEARIPFFNGTLCVQTPLVRALPIKNSGANHLAEFPFGKLVGHAEHPSLMPRTEIHAQIWFCDPSHSHGTGIGLTNALRFYIRL